MMTGRISLIEAIFDWLAERLRDITRWPIMLLRLAPVRLRRVLWTLGRGLRGVIALPGGLWRASRAGETGHWARERGAALAHGFNSFISQLFDLIGGGEILQTVMHLAMGTTPLTGDEIAAASSVLGPKAIRYDEVRVAEGGILDLVFRINGNRAFATWHTIHFSRNGRHTRANLPILIHELTHVYQYERVGSRYLGEAIYKQLRLGQACYDYGQAEGLRTARAEGKRFAGFNREQQAQIPQHYYSLRERGDDVSAYEPFLAALRAGEFG